MISTKQVQNFLNASRVTIAKLMFDGHSAWLLAKNNDAFILESSKMKDIFVLGEKYKITSRPPLDCVTFLSPLVMKFPDGDKIDLINEKIFAVINGNAATQSSNHLPQEVLLFNRGHESIDQYSDCGEPSNSVSSRRNVCIIAWRLLPWLLSCVNIVIHYRFE